jgi:hypothetical protein
MYWLMTPALKATSAAAVLSVAEVANKPVAVKAVAIAVDNSFFMLHSNVFNVSIKCGCWNLVVLIYKR